MNYMGEHDIWIQSGRFAVALAFAAALIASITYLMSWMRKDGAALRRAGRAAFMLHAAGVIGTVVILFVAILNHWYELDYVWRHSSNDLPLEYIASCFWEGQEGSFLLWMFWQSVIGLVLIKVAGQWEAGVVGVLSIVQVFLTSMILGVYLGDLHIGSSPFILIRELPENLGLPWTDMVDYLMRVPGFSDGQGLNPLLQNYWMVIHPPTLFLGFALITVPFSYAMAALLNRDYSAWVNDAMPWVFAGVGILGTGVLMGGAWAYEALSFGGFWAWDPVENASLVPWLTLVALGHLMIIERVKRKATTSTLMMAMLTFFLVLYSTFLTRSGILGDSSVHAFVDLGLNGQLLVFLGFFSVLPLGLFLMRWKDMPKSPSEDAFSSREFWMFIGSLTLLLSAAQITFSTSIPVINKLVGPDGMIALLSAELAPPVEPFAHYHSLQIPFAILITTLMAIGPYLRWKSTPWSLFKRITLSGVISLLIASLVVWGLALYTFSYALLIFTSLFAVISNATYWLKYLKGQWTVGAMTISHLGFALILIGAVISNAKKEPISTNSTFIHQDFPSNENLLMPFGDTLSMYPYWVVWTGEHQDGHNRVFDVDFYLEDDSTHRSGTRLKLNKAFTLHPFVQINETMGNVREPSTKHYWDRDIYTYVSYADLRPASVKNAEWAEPMTAIVAKGESILLFNQYLLNCDSIAIDLASFDQFTGDLANLSMRMILRVQDSLGVDHPLDVTYQVQGSSALPGEQVLEDMGLKIRFDGVSDAAGQFKITAWERNPKQDPFILMQAFVFPYINVLWLGSLLLLIGSVLSVAKRIKKLKG